MNTMNKELHWFISFKIIWTDDPSQPCSFMWKAHFKDFGLQKSYCGLFNNRFKQNTSLRPWQSDCASAKTGNGGQKRHAASPLLLQHVSTSPQPTVDNNLWNRPRWNRSSSQTEAWSQGCLVNTASAALRSARDLGRMNKSWKGELSRAQVHCHDCTPPRRLQLNREEVYNHRKTWVQHVFLCGCRLNKAY